MVYKCTNNFGLLTIFVNDLNSVQKFTKEIPGKRASLRCPSAGFVAGQRAFTFCGAKSFNSLPKFIRDTASLSGFKRRILKNIFYS